MSAVRHANLAARFIGGKAGTTQVCCSFRLRVN
jgi:hypothetical protein